VPVFSQLTFFLLQYQNLYTFSELFNKLQLEMCLRSCLAEWSWRTCF